MMNLSTAARAVGGNVLGADVGFAGVSTDSRGIAAGELFVALVGERFDGHDFIAQVRERGAVAAMVAADRVAGLAAAGLPLLVVDDPRRGLGRLAAYWRRQFALPVIAVTGSNGKTTVKEMIAAILRAHARLDGLDPERAVLATRGNLNNDIGLPLTLLTLNAQHRAAVVEMGMNHPGEIAYLADIAAPTVSVVNNAQRAHVEGLGSVAAIAREKGEIIAHAAPDAVAVINADDASAAIWRAAAGARRIVSFSLDAAADVRGECRAGALETSLRLNAGDFSLDVRLHVPGRHNAANATAAAAAALAAGVSPAAIGAGLDAWRPVRGRLQARAGLAGTTVLDDTYNANPDSVRAGLDVLAQQPGRRIMVLGDMGEIGADAERFHEEVGAYARRLGIDRFFALGPTSALAARAFGDGGAHFGEPEALLAALRPELGPATTVLVKGSRFMKMERVADALCADAHSGENSGENH